MVTRDSMVDIISDQINGGAVFLLKIHLQWIIPDRKEELARGERSRTWTEQLAALITYIWSVMVLKERVEQGLKSEKGDLSKNVFYQWECIQTCFSKKWLQLYWNVSKETGDLYNKYRVNLVLDNKPSAAKLIGSDSFFDISKRYAMQGISIYVWKEHKKRWRNILSLKKSKFLFCIPLNIWPFLIRQRQYKIDGRIYYRAPHRMSIFTGEPLRKKCSLQNEIAEHLILECECLDWKGPPRSLDFWQSLKKSCQVDFGVHGASRGYVGATKYLFLFESTISFLWLTWKINRVPN